MFAIACFAYAIKHLYLILMSRSSQWEQTNN